MKTLSSADLGQLRCLECEGAAPGELESSLYNEAWGTMVERVGSVILC